MKIITLLLILSTVLLTTALPTPDELLLVEQNDRNVHSIAELYINANTRPAGDFSQGIISPKNGDVWHVGQEVEVRFRDDIPSNETVSIFFYHQTDVLAGGSLEKKTFSFVVPPKALSPPNQYSMLIAVRRVENYLDAVDTVNITVLPA